MKKQQISDYVEVIIDEDEDVHIFDTFLGQTTESILPKEEALAVAKYIVQELENND